ncbi:NADH oxidase [Paenibacillus baekrokdamisoli]|uniref:NADH oxidase n=1 Tax=Paenibacillus baekrokdamisoli TaxID=1712516 RepID=A0A3G9J6V0_9BACL|nr:SagB family peptide dehydrogenase [Paenibacillus baekrokdamisoli]MBB3067303.1 SagB-type dehydrogenase family enzyme [Paenibacillus baekrokdamisoli]BBH19508.1 NADH oxidase [Paenibacillus baekrokdamisoli]
MSLKKFLYDLQFDPDKVKPLDWEANWEDAPLPYKLYRRLPAVSLSADMPLTLEGGKVPAKPDLREIGHFLWYVYGLAQVSQSVFVSDSKEEEMVGPLQMYRRFAPSGGGLYPNELYIYLKIEDLPVGVYHYDVAHHRLVLLREGNFDSYLGKALGNRFDSLACFGIAFVSTMFWKNFFKYNNFSYRLQGLDAGVLIGQLLEVAKRFGYESGVYFQFLDQAVNHLLGLSEQEESVYAVIPLTVEPEINWFAYGNDGDSINSVTELCQELAVVRHDHYVRSRTVLEFPMLIKMNEASMLDNVQLFQQIERENDVTCKDDTQVLPEVNRLSYDMAAVCRKRFSPETNFVLGQVSQLELAALLQEATVSFLYRNDLDGMYERPEPRVSLYGCFFGVEGIRDGAYRYDGATHVLQQVRPGDHRSWLQQGMSLDNLNLFQVPLCFHVVANKNHLQSQLGYRGYRIQQMEAGMLVQRLLLAASALGMGGHPLLGFDANTTDEIYRIAPQGKTSLIQIPVGPYRGRSRLEGSLSH